MKLIIILLTQIIVQVCLAQSVLCTATTSCSLGKASCSIDMVNSMSQTHGTCGIDKGKFRSCETTYSDRFGNTQESKKYICCASDGSAMIVADEATAIKLCASKGTVQ